MVIQPKCRGFICTTAHPVGCARNVYEQIDYAKQHSASGARPRNVLVIGASTGYGLASRIAAAYMYGANTVGVHFDKEATPGRLGTAGFYNNRAFETRAREDGYVAHSVNGDAFSDDCKAQTLALVKDTMGPVDLLVYSVAAPKRVDPRTGETHQSVIKPIGVPYTNKTVDFHTGVVSPVTIEPASEQEIDGTVAVMGGADWMLWVDALQKAGLLADGFVTTAFSYIGPALTHPIYKDGTIGRAKLDLERTARDITKWLSPTGGRAFVSVNKALVTQASSAIPVVPLYMSLLFKVMKARGTHEGCIEQLVRLYRDRLYTSGEGVPTDTDGRVRLDEYEMEPAVQAAVADAWRVVSTDNIDELSDLAGYRADFFKLFGFGRSDVDYDADVEV